MRGHLFVDVPLVAAAISLYPAYGLAPVAGLAGAAAAIHAWAVTDPRCSLYLPVWWRLPVDAPGCALTFDDGPNPEVTPRLLDALAAIGQQATFFVIGSHVRRHPELIRRMVSEGHAVGLHSDTHSRLFNCWPPGRVRRDLEACAAAIADAAGIPPPRLFRPPVGLKNPIVGWVAGCMDLVAVTWTARGRDTGSASAQTVRARLERGLVRRGIMVMHDGHEPGRAGARATCLEVVRLLDAPLRERNLRSLPLVAVTKGLALRTDTVALAEP